MRLLWISLLLVSQLWAYERVIALSPAINEIIFALGSGEKIIANTTFCTYPPKSQKKEKVGGFFAPNIEKIVALQPDIVLLQSHNYKLQKQLKSLDIKSQVSRVETFADIRTTILSIGKLLEKEYQAQSIVKSLDKKLSNLAHIVQNKKILIVIGHNLKIEKRIFVAGQNLYFDDIIKASGNQNAFQTTRKGQPILNRENIIATNPDIVILLAPYMKKKNLTKKMLIDPWLDLPISASKDKNIYVVGEPYAGIPSDRLAFLLDDFRGFLKEVRAKVDKVSISSPD